MITTIFQETHFRAHNLKIFPNLMLVRSLRSSFIDSFSSAKNAATLGKVLAPFFGQSCDRDRFLFPFISDFLSFFLFLYFIAIALFTVTFSHFHYNVFVCGCEAISGNFALFARNCLTSTFKYIVMQMRKFNAWFNFTCYHPPRATPGTSPALRTRGWGIV